jgi:hypothetical protein
MIWIQEWFCEVSFSRFEGEWYLSPFVNWSSGNWNQENQTFHYLLFENGKTAVFVFSLSQAQDWISAAYCVRPLLLSASAARSPSGRLSRPQSTMSWSDSRNTIRHPSLLLAYPTISFDMERNGSPKRCTESNRSVPVRLSLYMPRLITPTESPHLVKMVLRYWLLPTWSRD